MNKNEIDLLKYEHALINNGAKLIAGVDEVGRGPLAGPVVCCACIMPLDNIIDDVWDSKKLSAKKREEVANKIKESAICYNIAYIDETVIDKINILEATKLCMANAVNNLKIKPDVVLIDAISKIDSDIKQIGIIKGDMLSYSIGCASILAKVDRDNFMGNMAKTYENYGFEKHKGYGTKAHIEAIQKFGPCKIHRRTFIKHFVGEV